MKLHQEELLKMHTSSAFLDKMRSLCIIYVESDILIKTATEFGISWEKIAITAPLPSFEIKSDINTMTESERNINFEPEENKEKEGSESTINYTPTLFDDEGISLQESLIHPYFKQLWDMVPKRKQLNDLTRIYSTSKHGFNLNTFYRLCGDTSHIVVIKSKEGNIFGAFLSHGWKYGHEKKKDQFFW